MDLENPVVADSTPAEMSPEDALKEVLKKARAVDGLARGIHEATKVLEQRTAKVCVLSQGCTEAVYKQLVEGLCHQYNVPLMYVPDSKSLGEWAGLCKLDKDGKARKVVGASCVVVKNPGEETRALQVLMEHLSKK